MDKIPLAKAKAELSRNFKKVASSYDLDLFADKQLAEKIAFCINSYRDSISDTEFEEHRRGGGKIVAAAALASSLQSSAFTSHLGPLMHGVFIRTLKELNEANEMQKKPELQNLLRQNEEAIQIIGEKAMETLQPSISGRPQIFLIPDALGLDSSRDLARKPVQSTHKEDDIRLSTTYAREAVSLPFGIIAKQSEAKTKRANHERQWLASPGM